LGENQIALLSMTSGKNKKGKPDADCLLEVL
jgi:hypothetical protein